MFNETEIKIFAGSSSELFVEKMCKSLGIEPGKCEKIRFSDGNTFVRIGEKVRDKDVYIVQTIGTDPNNEFMELLFWVDAFKRASANSITAIMPYFGYAKADKKDEPRVSIRARVCADCLEISGVDRIVAMDFHSAQIQGFFKKPVDHLYSANLFCKYIQSLNWNDYTIVSPDEGFAKKARYFSTYLGAPLAICAKQRLSHDENAKIMEIVGSVENKDAIIVDDFTTTCKTLAGTAEVLKANGAKRIIACVTHSLFSQKTIEVLENSAIEKLVTTDSVYNTLSSSKIQILTVTDMFAKAVSILHNRESLSALFE